jgi:hypothetical protein
LKSRHEIANSLLNCQVGSLFRSKGVQKLVREGAWEDRESLGCCFRTMKENRLQSAVPRCPSPRGLVYEGVDAPCPHYLDILPPCRGAWGEGGGGVEGYVTMPKGKIESKWPQAEPRGPRKGPYSSHWGVEMGPYGDPQGGPGSIVTLSCNFKI